MGTFKGRMMKHYKKGQNVEGTQQDFKEHRFTGSSGFVGALRVQFIITRHFKLIIIIIIICNKSQNIFTFSRWSALKINRISKSYIFSIFYFRILHHNTRYVQMFKRELVGVVNLVWWG